MPFVWLMGPNDKKEEPWTFLISKKFDYEKFLNTYKEAKKLKWFHEVSTIKEGVVVEVFCSEEIKEDIKKHLNSNFKNVARSTPAFYT